MKRLIGAVLLLTLSAVGMLGCAEKSSTTTETQITTPGGTTTITTEKEIKQTGDNPPPATP